MLTETQIFLDHRNRLALYAKLKDRVKDRAKLLDRLVVRPTRKLQWELDTKRIAATKGDEG